MIIPKLTVLVAARDYTAWKAEFPAQPVQAGGSTYRVTTYPDSDEIHVKSWGRNTRVTNERRVAQIRAGLKHAKTAA